MRKIKSARNWRKPWTYKKKVDTELRVYFPHKYKEERDYNYLELYKSLLIKEGEYLIDPSDELEDKITSLRKQLLDFNKPNIFNPYSEDNIIYQLELNYEKMMIGFEENGFNARDYTVFQFEVAIKKNEDDIKDIRKNEN